MEKILHLSAVALSPTLEKEIIDRQKAIMDLFGLSSALALPPVYPLRFFSSPPPEGRGKNRQEIFSGPLTFMGYRMIGRHIYALADGIRDEAESGTDADGHELKEALFPVFPGFYLADRGIKNEETLDLSLIPALPSRPVRVVRSLTLRILLKGMTEEWWREIEWEIIREKYFNLRR